MSVSTMSTTNVQSGYTMLAASGKVLADDGKVLAEPGTTLAGQGTVLAANGRMTVQDRLKVLRGESSFRQFSERVGVNANSVRRYELGSARVPMDYVEAVCSTFGVSADWLIFGIETPTRQGVVGEMLAREESASSKRSVMINGERVRIVCVPVLNRVPAGAPAEMLDDMPVGFGLEGAVWVPDPGDRNAYALTAWGDSMEPIIRDGERFVVSPRRAHGFAAGIAVICIRAPTGADLGGDLCVKHVRVRQDCVVISPANPRYAATRYAPDEVTVLGRVMHVVPCAHSVGGAFAGLCEATYHRRLLLE